MSDYIKDYAQVTVNLPGQNDIWTCATKSTILPLDRQSRDFEIRRVLELALKAINDSITKKMSP